MTRLSHPAFLLSLVLLLINDWYWKPFYGNFLTGRLSTASLRLINLRRITPLQVRKKERERYLRHFERQVVRKIRRRAAEHRKYYPG